MYYVAGGMQVYSVAEGMQVYSVAGKTHYIMVPSNLP